MLKSEKSGTPDSINHNVRKTRIAPSCLGKKPVSFYDISIFNEIINFCFSLEALSNLHCFILTNFILNTLNSEIIKRVTTIIEIVKLNCR